MVVGSALKTYSARSSNPACHYRSWISKTLSSSGRCIAYLVVFPRNKIAVCDEIESGHYQSSVLSLVLISTDKNVNNYSSYISLSILPNKCIIGFRYVVIFLRAIRKSFHLIPSARLYGQGSRCPEKGILAFSESVLFQHHLCGYSCSLPNVTWKPR
jgi:hypothetical protein